jgi:hypothetical protein
LKAGLKKILFIVVSAITLSCANPLPPTGGPDDIEPPKVLNITPENNSVNFKGNIITIVFDEYVDRRSFEESFLIFPNPKSNCEFNWSGKEVKIIYEKNFEPDKTYNILVLKEFKDYQSGNKLKNTYNYVFSTGSEIDKNSVSGRVFSKTYNDIIIIAYRLDDIIKDSLNPAKTIPDYVAQCENDGHYSLNNLRKGNYRLFAITDKNRNFIFEQETENAAIPFEDIILADSTRISNFNFNFYDFDVASNSELLIKNLVKDTSGSLLSNIQNNAQDIPVNYKFYFSFCKSDLSKNLFANNLLLEDTINKINEKIIFNWFNDTLVEVNSENQLKYNHLYIFSLLINDKKNINFSFTTLKEGNTADVWGNISTPYEKNKFIVTNLFNETDIFLNYNLFLNSDTSFYFKNVPRGNYMLCAYIDDNSDGIYQKGNSFPFIFSEKLTFYDGKINIRGKINFGNINLNF